MTYQTFSTGQFKPVYCERCRRRLFDGIMQGVIRCHWCKWDNRFFKREVDDNHKTAYSVKSA